MTAARKLSQTRPTPRRGLSRSEAAMYVGVSATKFDQLILQNKMPGPRLIDTRKIWDVRELDLAFDALPGENDGEASWADR